MLATGGVPPFGYFAARAENAVGSSRSLINTPAQSSPCTVMPDDEIRVSSATTSSRRPGWLVVIVMPSPSGCAGPAPGGESGFHPAGGAGTVTDPPSA